MSKTIDKRVSLELRTMNAGNRNEFDRLFITCHKGHELGSVPVASLWKGPLALDVVCTHYEHKTERAKP